VNLPCGGVEAACKAQSLSARLRLVASQILSLKNHRPHAEIFWQFSRRMDAALLTQGKDDNKEKWQNSRREACCTLSIEGKSTKTL
jgi:hypothetical protein